MAAYSPYELFRVLIERVGWPTEEDKKAATASVAEMESMAIFGNLARMMECPHDADAMRNGKCTDCGKQVTGGSGQWR